MVLGITTGTSNISKLFFLIIINSQANSQTKSWDDMILKFLQVVFLSNNNKPDATLICLMQHPEEFEN